MRQNSKGVTLIELLTVLAIISIVVLLAGPSLLLGQKQNNLQTVELQKQRDMRLVFNMMTKDIRRAKSGSENVVVTTSSSPTPLNPTTVQITMQDGSTKIYKYDGTQILDKDNVAMAKNIKTFLPTKDAQKVSFTLTANDTKSTSLTATIYFRK